MTRLITAKTVPFFHPSGEEQEPASCSSVHSLVWPSVDHLHKRIQAHTHKTKAFQKSGKFVCLFFNVITFTFKKKSTVCVCVTCIKQEEGKFRYRIREKSEELYNIILTM